LKGLEEEGEIAAGSAELFSGLWSKDYATRQQSITGISDKLYNSNTMRGYLGQMQQNAGDQTWWYSTGVGMVDQIAGIMGMSEQMKEHFKNPANMRELEKAVDDYVGDIDKTIAGSFKGITNLDLSVFDSLQDAINALSGIEGDEAAGLIALI
jgi:hypothetical protein